MDVMMDKQIYDLEREDILNHSVWFFPMDDTVEDELTVRPMQNYDLTSDLRLIVKTTFTDRKGHSYIGYVYWSQPELIEDVQPVLFTGDRECISFWNGIVKPSWDDYTVIQQEIKHLLPIKYQSESISGLSILSGALEGLYFFDDRKQICCYIE